MLHFENHMKGYTSLSAKVVAVGSVVSRDGMVNNERVLILAVQEIGSRVSIDVNYLHLKSLYDFMKISIDGAMS